MALEEGRLNFFFSFLAEKFKVGCRQTIPSFFHLHTNPSCESLPSSLDQLDNCLTLIPPNHFLRILCVYSRDTTLEGSRNPNNNSTN